MHALVGEVLARRADVLGRDTEPGAAPDRLLIIETDGHGHAHPAAGDIQIQRLVEAGAAMLQEHVATGNADIRCAMLDIGRRVRGAHDDDADIGPVGIDDQLARGLRMLERNDARRCQERQGFLEDAALRQGDGDAVHGEIRAKKPILPQPPHAGAERTELLLKMLVAAVEMVDALDHGFALGHQSGDDQAGRGA